MKTILTITGLFLILLLLISGRLKKKIVLIFTNLFLILLLPMPILFHLAMIARLDMDEIIIFYSTIFCLTVLSFIASVFYVIAKWKQRNKSLFFFICFMVLSTLFLLFASGVVVLPYDPVITEEPLGEITAIEEDINIIDVYSKQEK